MRQALQALRSLLLRRMGRADQAWHELMQIVPHGTRILGAVNVTGPIERGWCELELGRLDEARSSFDEAAGALWAARDPQWVAASLEGQAAAALRCDAPQEAGQLLSRADAIRLDAPAVFNLHSVEVDQLRQGLRGRQR
ncbi:hypothetical protein BH18ACT2_BH18ACT2_10160 [soil metagenome]